MTNTHYDHPISRTISVTGMSCSSCEQTLVKGLSVFPGVLAVKPDHQKGRVKVTYDLLTTRLKKIEEQLVQLCYPLENTFWARTKRDLAHFTEQNEFDNLTHKSTCCNKPPLVG